MFLRPKSSSARCRRRAPVENRTLEECPRDRHARISYREYFAGNTAATLLFFAADLPVEFGNDRVEGNLTEHRELGALLSRVERLEKQNRRLKQGALVCLLAIASVALLAQTKQTTPSTAQKRRAPAPAPAPTGPTAVEAQAFILKDSNGRVRAELGLTGSTPSLKFKDESGSALVTLALNSDAPGGPMLLLSDPQHHASVALSVLEHAGPQLALTGERADIQLHMGVAPDGTTLELSDKDGFTTSIGSGVVAKNGQAKQTSAASIVLYGKQRKLLWSVP